MRALVVGTLGAALCSACGDSAPSPASQIDRARYETDLTAIAGTRSPGTPHWQEVQDLCADRFASLGFEVERHAYATGVNVIGVRTGTKLPAERVVVSAHYDSVPNCEGADDNGSGVAATLEAARVLSLKPHDRTLVVACWDEEERGLIGSKAYVARAKAAGDAITLSLVFETIGYRNTAPMSQKSDPQLETIFPDAGNQIKANEYRGDFALVVNDEPAAAAVVDMQAVAKDIGLPIVNLSLLAPLKTLAPLRRSDHAPFWDAEYPAIFVTDTADYRNTHYHCYNSTVDALADIDFAFAVASTKVVVAAAAGALDR
ncbi:MAG TPA: M20/M25/M40 family metallo-hydrolase [Kofleriaceae bacterium]|nr:M20/M25/M40 family metallo-hydrolase [Kofleriaceae bacterium]